MNRHRGPDHEHRRARRLPGHHPDPRLLHEDGRPPGDDLEGPHQGPRRPRRALERRGGSDAAPRAHPAPRAAPGAPGQAAAHQPGRRRPPHRRGRLHPARHHPVLEPDAGPAVVRHRRAHVGLVIAALRRIPQEMAALRAGRWQAYPIGTGLRGKILGIYGYGKIGSVVAGYGKAFGMNVIVWGRPTTMEKARADGQALARNRDAFFSSSDVVSLHVRLVPETRGMITAADLALMKPTAVMVNTSRAGLIAPGALEAALRAGRPGLAAVDVFEEEPVLGAQHPLLALDNCVCVPHLGYVERDGLEQMFSTIFDQILAYAGGKPINVMNPKVRQASGRAKV